MPLKVRAFVRRHQQVDRFNDLDERGVLLALVREVKGPVGSRRVGIELEFGSYFERGVGIGPSIGEMTLSARGLAFDRLERPLAKKRGGLESAIFERERAALLAEGLLRPSDVMGNLIVWLYGHDAKPQ